MPRYGISNVPTEVKEYPPDQAGIQRDWGIYVYQAKMPLALAPCFFPGVSFKDMNLKLRTSHIDVSDVSEDTTSIPIHLAGAFAKHI